MELKGIDVSHWQGPIDWKQVSENAFKDFAFIKVSEKTFADSRFTENWRNAKGLVPRGGYMFFRPTFSVELQVNYFLEKLGDDQGELRVALDVEAADGLLPKVLSERVKQALDLLEGRLGYKPILYTSAQFWNNNVLKTFPEVSWSKDYPLWVAHYNLNIPQPRVPRGWPTWDIWQYWAEGTVPGINGDVDLNHMKLASQNKIFIQVPPTLEERVTKIEMLLKENNLWH